MKKRFKIFFIYSLLVIFIGYYGSISLFYHTHYFLGDTIVHSHPFKSDAGGRPHHSHNENGFVTVQFLSSILLSSVVAYYSFRVFTQVESELIVRTRELQSYQSTDYHYSLRGPPQICSFGAVN